MKSKWTPEQQEIRKQAARLIASYLTNRFGLNRHDQLMRAQGVIDLAMYCNAVGSDQYARMNRNLSAYAKKGTHCA